MKIPIKKLDERTVRNQYPIISDQVPSWFFRMEEVSAGAWVVEGTDLWGRKVGEKGHEEQELLRSCFEAAKRINSQVTTK